MTGESKRLLVHVFVMLAAAVACAVVFALPEERESKGVVLIDKRPDDLTEMVFESGDKRVRVLPRKGGGFTLAFTLFGKKAAVEKGRSKERVSSAGQDEEKKGQKVSQGEEKASVAKEQEGSHPETRSYRASKEFERRLADLLPLRIERELEADGAEGKFGLDSASKTLSFEFGKARIRFYIGKQTYGGASTYIRKDSGGPIYLVSSSLIRAIDVRPPRYMERRLFEAGRNDVDRVIVTDALGKKSSVLVKVGDNLDKWVPEHDRDTTSNTYGTWVGKLFLLSADDYPDKSPTDPQVAGRVKLLRGGKLQDEIVFARTMEMDTEGKEKKNNQKGEGGSTGKTVFWARSGFTGQWVRLRATTARSFFEDLPEILGRS